jgi:hypothetical protein
MAVPYTFGSATTSIPLSQLDSNFATTITLGNTAIQLGNTVTTLNNMTLGNVTISSGTSNIQTNVANATGVLLEANGGTGTTTGYYGFKNRIINGAMVIDQRNAGASVSNTGAVAYTTDRWYSQGASSAGVFSCQQVTDAPTGFAYSEKLTVTTSSTPSGTQTYRYIQRIEGNNLADFNLGLSGCSSFTLSFWVKSSLTGTFGGSFWGAGATRWFIFSYTVNSANTWEYKTATITPITSGSFDTTTGIGLQLSFNIGAASSVLGSAGSWISNAGSPEYYGPTGQTNIIATNGATWQISGVQLEKGSTATSFDYRPYGTELSLCQRYYYLMSAASNLNTFFHNLAATSTTNALGVVTFPQVMRASPSLTTSGTASNYRLYIGGAFTTCTSGPAIDQSCPYSSNLSYNVASGLTNGQGGCAAANGSTSAILGFSAEL